MKQDIVYDPENYDQLPNLFDIEVRVSPTGNRVTLYINGTNYSDGVTVLCRNLSNPVIGQIETFFVLELEFVCKFIISTAIINLLPHDLCCSYSTSSK